MSKARRRGQSQAIRNLRYDLDQARYLAGAAAESARLKIAALKRELETSRVVKVAPGVQIPLALLATLENRMGAMVAEEVIKRITAQAPTVVESLGERTLRNIARAHIPAPEVIDVCKGLVSEIERRATRGYSARPDKGAVEARYATTDVGGIVVVQLIDEEAILHGY